MSTFGNFPATFLLSLALSLSQAWPAEPSALEADCEAFLEQDEPSLRLVRRDDAADGAGLDPGDSAPYFDELTEILPDGRRRVRPQYAAAIRVRMGMSENDVEKFTQDSLQMFEGDNALDPLPRILTRSEYEYLKRGVEQRGNALRMFLQDHYSGERRYLQAGIFSEAGIQAIVRRANEQDYDGLVKPEQIAFLYGPDIIRAADGRWYVIEDNPGYVGGLGDLILARQTLYTLQPAYQNLIESVTSPEDFYRNLVSRYREQAIPRDGKIVLYMTPPYPDNEDPRIGKIFESLGVEIVTDRSPRRLVVKQDGVYLKEKKSPGHEERVGFVILNGEHKWLDVSHPITRDAYLRMEAEAHLEQPDLKPQARSAIEAALAQPNPRSGLLDEGRMNAAFNRSNFRNDYPSVRAKSPTGLVQAIFDGKVGASYSAGVDFIGDKEFNASVDDLVRFYLGEDPLLPSLPTLRFAVQRAGGGVLADPSALERVFANGAWKNWVIKKVDGRGGDGVFVGPKLTPELAEQVMAKVRANPEAYIAQPFTALSRMGEFIVDLRMLSDVNASGVTVSPVPWCRGVSIHGDGKVNISQNGREFAVIVVEDPR